MLVSGVFSSCAASERNRSLRDSRSAAARTAAARVSSGRSGRRSRSAPSKRMESAPTIWSCTQRGTAAHSAPHSTRPLSRARAASSAVHGRPSLPSICRPAPVLRWTATPSAPLSRLAIFAMRPASSRVFSPSRAASASCAAAPEERNAVSMRRWSENSECRNRSARCSSAVRNDPRTMRAPSRRNPSVVPGRASSRRARSRPRAAIESGRRSHSDQNGCSCAGRRSSTRRRLRGWGSHFGPPASQSGHA